MRGSNSSQLTVWLFGGCQVKGTSRTTLYTKLMKMIANDPSVILSTSDILAKENDVVVNPSHPLKVSRVTEGNAMKIEVDTWSNRPYYMRRCIIDRIRKIEQCCCS